MDEFRNQPLVGAWWLPGKPEDIFKGRLTIGDDNNGRLVLNGTQEHLAKLPTGETQPTFFGRLEADYSYDVTLFDVALRRGPTHSYPKDPLKETIAEYATHTLLVGGHIASQDEALFDAAIFKLTGLDEWCDATGFTGRHENTTPNEMASGSLTIAFQERETPRYNLGNGSTLRFLSEYELTQDLQAFHMGACAHAESEIRIKTVGRGAQHYYRQCLHCGTSVSTALKKKKDLEGSPSWDVQLEPRYYQKRDDGKRDVIQRHVRIQRDRLDGFQRDYDLYLRSPEWAQKRAKVFKRANGTCEGCLENKATQVHHLTYEHFKNELMFELVAICDACHKLVHADKHDGSTQTATDNDDDFELLAGGLFCDGCRWQDERNYVPWCSILNVPAKVALDADGECGPDRHSFEPLK